MKPAVTHFISGHLDITDEEFAEHYIPKLQEAINNGDRFVVGDADGTDFLAQNWLYPRTPFVTIYHMFENPRNNAGFPAWSGFKSDKKRDEAMTKVSDKDIAWVRPGRENSGTAENIKRRIGHELKANS